MNGRYRDANQFQKRARAGRRPPPLLIQPATDQPQIIVGEAELDGGQLVLVVTEVLRVLQICGSACRLTRPAGNEPVHCMPK
jgi:hypothetical protein